MFLTPKYLLLATRPRQWTKNLLIYFAFLFTIGEAWTIESLNHAVHLLYKCTLAFVCFCIVSSAVYIINDLVDIEKDKQHPTKRFRPLAAGLISFNLALVFSLLLSIIGIISAFSISFYLGLIASLYLITMVAYSFYLKNIVILDVLTISGGFVLRAVAGAVVLGVSISPWLYVCTSLGALFIGFSKRYSELLLATNIGQRETLSNYSIKLLEQLIAIVAPSTLVSYIFYTFTAETLPGNHAMMLTIPFVMYGLFRYLTLVHHENLGEKPEEILLTDMPLLINIVLWLITASLILFLFR